MSHCVEKESLISSAASSDRKQTSTCSHGSSVELQLSPNWNRDVLPIYLRLTTLSFVFDASLLGNFPSVAFQRCPCLLAVRLLLRPSFSHTQVGLGDIKETPFCNVTEDVSLSEPKKGLTSTTLQLTVSQFQMIFLIIHTVCCCGVQRIWLVQPLT